MICRYTMLAAAGLAMAACSTTPEDGFAAGRTVFDNPYVAPELREPSAESAGLFYPGAGCCAYDSEGNRVELTRAERRAFRERARNAGEQAELNELVREFDARDAELRPDPVPSAPARAD